MSAPRWGRGPEPPAGEGELRGPGRVQTSHVGGGAAVFGVTGKRRAFPESVEEGRPPERIGLQAIPPAVRWLHLHHREQFEGPGVDKSLGTWWSRFPAIRGSISS